MTSYIRFSLLGVDCEVYLTELRQKGFKIRNLENKDNVFYGIVKPSDYIKMAKLTKKKKLRLRIKEKKGILFKILPYKKRIGIPLGVLVFAGLIYFFSGKVWDIDITGNSKISDAQLLELLETCGIYAGADSGSFMTAAAEVNAMLYLDDLAWISIENQGSRVYVKINERLDAEEAKIPLSAPCNVVATHTGIIISTEVYRGKLVMPVGSAVAEGDIIVTGTVNDNGGHIIQNHASAKIIAEYTEELEFYQEYTTVETVKTGTIEEKDYIQLFSFTLPSQRQYPKNNYVYSTENRIVSFFGIRMPWTIRRVIGEETEKITVTRCAEDVNRILQREFEQYCANHFNDAEIINTEKTYFDDGEGIRLTVTLVLQGDIASEKEIFAS